jgi:hypothetical protein
MNFVNCRIILYEGNWERPLSEDAIYFLMKRAFPDSGECSLASLDFVKPSEDVAFEAEAGIITDWSDKENVSDRIIEKMLVRFEPEYETMIEVEVWENNDAC